MIVKINGKEIEQARHLEVSQEASDAAAWGVILIGVIACIGWWQLWR